MHVRTYAYTPVNMLMHYTHSWRNNCYLFEEGLLLITYKMISSLRNVALKREFIYSQAVQSFVLLE